MGAVRDANFEPRQLGPCDSPSVLERFFFSRSCLDYLSVGPAMHFQGQMPRSAYTIIFVTACPTPGRSFNFSIQHGDGFIGFFPPGGILDASTPKGYENASFSVSADLFERETARDPGLPEPFLDHGAAVKVGGREAAHLRVLITRLRETLLDPVSLLWFDSARQAAESELLQAFLAALRSGVGRSLVPTGLRIAKRGFLLRKALDMIKSEPRRELGINRLCQEIGVSRRSIEYVFRDLLGVSPNAYIKTDRLHRARRILHEARPASGMVKFAALEAGFWHLGHFSHDYRVLFGESPQVTLARLHSRCQS